MTIQEILEGIGWPLGQHGRTTCPLHQGSNESAFSYTDAVWFCFGACGGGGIKDLAERLGLREIPHHGLAPRGAEFALDFTVTQRRPARPVWQPGYGKLSRYLTAQVEEIESQVRYQWEVAHRHALCDYREAEELLSWVTEDTLDLVWRELRDALERLEATHAHLRVACPGDCYLRDDPRPRD